MDRLDAPFLTVFMPPRVSATCSVVIAPGGSNIMLMYGGEGMISPNGNNEWGVAAFVLTYRLSPKYNAGSASARWKEGSPDGAISERQNGKLDPKRLGFAGFSAGSEIARVMASAGHGDSNAADPIERFECNAELSGAGVQRGTSGAQRVAERLSADVHVSAAGDVDRR